MMRSLLARRCVQFAGGLALLWVSDTASAAAPCAPSPYAAYYQAPYAGPMNHAHTAPQFQWGHFGAEQFYPQVGWHRDYNGELMRWSTKRRY